MTMITDVQNRRLHALLTQSDMMAQKANLINGFTQQRTASSKEMATTEAQEMIDYLEKEVKLKTGRMKGKIIHLMCLMGYVQRNNSPDYARINEYVLNRTGQNNPQKKRLEYLNATEMKAVLNQVEQMYKKTLI